MVGRGTAAFVAAFLAARARSRRCSRVSAPSVSSTVVVWSLTNVSTHSSTPPFGAVITTIHPKWATDHLFWELSGENSGMGVCFWWFLGVTFFRRARCEFWEVGLDAWGRPTHKYTYPRIVIRLSFSQYAAALPSNFSQCSCRQLPCRRAQRVVCACMSAHHHKHIPPSSVGCARCTIT